MARESKSSPSSSRINTTRTFVFLFLVTAVVSMITNFRYHLYEQFVDSGSTNFLEKRSSSSRTKQNYNDKHEVIRNEGNGSHEISGLRCEPYGGPSPEIANEMVYWSDIPSDSKVKSPFRDETNTKYLTFEPDHGGWNNIRMAMETVLVLAHAMGRTLVLPPDAPMYLLKKSTKGQKAEFSFNDFFHLDSLEKEHEGLDIITMEDFLLLEASTNNLVDYSTLKPLQPPKGRTNWNGANLGGLWDYLRKVGHVQSDWNPNECTAAIPASKDPNDILELERIIEDINASPQKIHPQDFKGKPFPVDAPAIDRLKENMCDRTELCIYDEEMQNAPLVHFQVGTSKDNKKLRLLTHFYSFIFFQDWKQDLWAKRFIRDHVRYIDEIMCAGARVVNEVRKKSQLAGKGGAYHSFHVRRGDFQYKKTRIVAEELLKRSQRHLEKGSVLYIATDERTKSFFKPLKEDYEVYFMNDFDDVLSDINTNYYGMIDQLVASKGEKFIGTWFSTLSGYVNRIRGYHSAKNKLKGYENGELDSWYFIPDDRQDEMQVYWPVRKPIYMREFPTSWRGIDKGIDEIVDDMNKRMINTIV